MRKDRQPANRQLVAMIADLVEKYPDMRFGQILSALDINTTQAGADGWTLVAVDNFYHESVDILARAWAAKGKLGV